MIDFKVRDVCTEDISFIMSTWLKSYRKTQDNKRIVNGVYFPHTSNIITTILSGAKVLIAYNPLEEDHIYGYIVYNYLEEVLIIHYTYTKRQFRRFGIMRSMIEQLKKSTELPTICTFATPVYDVLKDRMNLMYNPFMRG